MSDKQKLNKPSIDNKRNIWQLMIQSDTKLLECANDIGALQSFIQAPDNGFLLHTILKNFVELPKYLFFPNKPCDLLTRHINTASLLLTHAENLLNLYVDTVKIEAYLEKVASLNQERNSAKDIQYFLENQLFSQLDHVNYKSDRPLYICLFYPYANGPLNHKLSDAYDTMKNLRAMFFNQIASGKIEHTSEQLESLYQSYTKIASDKYYYHLLFKDEEFDSLELAVNNLTDMISELQAIATNKTRLENHFSLQTMSDISVEKFEQDVLKNAIKRIRDMRAFFNRYLKENIQEQDDTSGHSENQGRKNYKRGSGIVSFTGNIKFDTRTVTFPGDNAFIKHLKLVQMSALTGVEGESQADCLELDDELPCRTKDPYVKVVSGRRKHPHIALYNQFLLSSVPQSKLQKYFDVAVKGLTSYNDQTQPESIDVAKDADVNFGVLLLLMTGRIIKLVTLDNQNKEPSKKVALDNVYYTVKTDQLWLSLDAYKYRRVSTRSKLYQSTYTQLVPINIPYELKSLLRDFAHKRLQDDIQINLNIKGLVASYVNALYPFEIHTDQILTSIFKKILMVTNGDLWSASLLTGDTKSLANTQKHYASIRFDRFQLMFREHLKYFMPIRSVKLSAKNVKQRVGSPLFVDEKNFSYTLRVIRLLIRYLIYRLEKSTLFSRDAVHLFNLINFYTDTMIAFAAGTRDVIDPYIPLKSINKLGWTVINDKNNYNGYNTRLVYLPASVIENMKNFEVLKGVLIRKLTDRGVLPNIVKFSKNNDADSTNQSDDAASHSYSNFENANNLFLLIYKGITDKRGREYEITPLAYTRTAAFELADNAIEYFISSRLKDARYFNLVSLYRAKSNINRHYLRGKLLDMNISPHFIDAYLGHWHLGTEPWSWRSLFDQKAYQLTMSKAIDQLMSELKFRPLKLATPLTRKRRAAHREDQ